MAYTREQLMKALRNADAAGDTAGATRIAQMVKAQQQAPQQEAAEISQEENARQDHIVNNANGFDRFMFGVLNGLMDVGRGVGLFKDMTPEEQAALESLHKKMAAKQSFSQDVGEFVGQAVPFVGGAGLVSLAPRGAARFAAAAGLGATEGGIIANGTGGDVATGAAIGAIVAPAVEGIAPLVGKAAKKIKGKVTNQTLKKADKAMNSSLFGGEKAAQKFVHEAQPDPTAIKAIQDLGLESHATPGMISQNHTLRALENAVANLPGTAIHEGHRNFISELGKKADDLITTFGGDLDKQAVAERVATSFNQTIQGLQSQADIIYDKIRNTVPVRKNIEASKTRELLESHAQDLGGFDYLPPILKSTLQRLDQETSPTYGRLDDIRKKVGNAIGKKDSPFKDEDTGNLKRLYAAITDDQQFFVEKYGAGELWALGKALTKKRKDIEDQAQYLLGKQMQQSAIPKVENAMVKMAKGDGSDFHQLMRTVPDSMRKEVALTSMNKAFTTFAKSPGQQLGIDGFVKWYNGIQRNASNLTALHKVIGADASKRLLSIYQAANAMNRLNASKQYPTRLVDQQVRDFLKEGGTLSKIYGIAKKAIPAEIALSSLVSVGVGTLVTVLSAARKSRIRAADELLSSPEFKKMLFDAKSTPSDRPEVRKAIEARVIASKAFERWKHMLPNEEVKNLSRVGLIAWLAGDRTPSDEQ